MASYLDGFLGTWSTPTTAHIVRADKWEFMGVELPHRLTGLFNGFANIDHVYTFADHLDPVALDQSLRVVLGTYPVLAGRSAEHGAHIVCNNVGVPLNVVREAGHVQDIPAEPKRGAYCDIPNPVAQVAGRAPLMTIKLTLFNGGGCCLGVTISHLVCDGWSFAMFVKDWSEVHNGGEIEPVVFQPPRRLCDAPTETVVRSSAEALDLRASTVPLVARLLLAALKPVAFPILFRIVATIADPKPPPRTRLHFSDKELKQLKKAAEERRGDWVSTNEALLAHIYDVLLDTFQLPDEQRANLAVCVLANLRGRAGISNRFFGNAVSRAICPVDFRRNSGAQTPPDSVDMPITSTAKAQSDLCGKCAETRNQGADLPSVVHDALRAQMTEKRLFMFVELLSWVSRQMFLVSSGVVFVATKMPNTPGMLNHWNNSMSYPINRVDFGAGAPMRSINRNGGEAVRVVPCPLGGVDILVSQARSGIGGWRAQSPWCSWAPGPIRTWAQLSSWCFILFALSLLYVAICLARGDGLSVASCVAFGASYALRTFVNKQILMTDFFDALVKHPMLHMYDTPEVGSDAIVQDPLKGKVDSSSKPLTSSGDLRLRTNAAAVITQ